MWSFCAFFPLARASVGPRAEFGAPQPLSVSAPGHAPRGSVEYEQASGRGPTPLPYLSYFCMWWAGAVAIDVTTSGCVALVEAAPPTDALNIYIPAFAKAPSFAPLGGRAAPDRFPPHFCGGTVYGYRGRSSAPACALSSRKFVCWVCAPFGQCQQDAARGGVRSRNPKHNVHMPSSQQHVCIASTCCCALH